MLLRSVTMHPYRPQVEHVDFQRVQKDKKLHMKVPLHFVNAEKSPGVKDQGGVVSHVLNEIDITCLPDDLPEFVEVDLGNLAVGNSIHARDLKLPKGVELALGKAENPVVATVVVPQLITEEEEAAAVVSAAGRADHRAGRRAEGRRGGCRGRQGRCRDKGGDKAAQGWREAALLTRPIKKTRSDHGLSSAWATRARSTSARGTTPASGWSSASRRRAASRCARTRSSRRWSARTPAAPGSCCRSRS